jgi:hypothetical protein
MLWATPVILVWHSSSPLTLFGSRPDTKTSRMSKDTIAVAGRTWQHSPFWPHWTEIIGVAAVVDTGSGHPDSSASDTFVEKPAEKKRPRPTPTPKEENAYEERKRPISRKPANGTSSKALAQPPRGSHARRNMLGCQDPKP